MRVGNLASINTSTLLLILNAAAGSSFVYFEDFGEVTHIPVRWPFADDIIPVFSMGHNFAPRPVGTHTGDFVKGSRVRACRYPESASAVPGAQRHVALSDYRRGKAP